MKYNLQSISSEKSMRKIPIIIFVLGIFNLLMSLDALIQASLVGMFLSGSLSSLMKHSMNAMILSTLALICVILYIFIFMKKIYKNKCEILIYSSIFILTFIEYYLGHSGALEIHVPLGTITIALILLNLYRFNHWIYINYRNEGDS